jgi:phosphatidylserine decarboxylase
MSMFSTVRRQLAPIHREGYPFVALAALISVVLFWIAQPLGWLGLIATAWCAYFFRDPRRVTPVGNGLVIAPADGLVAQVTTAPPPPELELGAAPRVRISIFMSGLDVHINRSPVSGKIEKIAYKSGKFLNADLDKASEENERNGFVIEAGRGKVAVVQIAGLIARRIVCFAREGEAVAAGERIGMIRFGSRVDVYLPQGTHTLVAEGQYAVAGETVLADLDAKSRELTFRIG